MSMKVSASMTPFDPSAGLPDKRVPLTDVAKQVSKRISVKIPKTPDQIDVYDVLKFAWVPAEKIYINYERQRWPEPKHIAKLNAKWDIHCVTPLQARYCPKTDRYFGSDGQQHIIEWLLKYGLNSLVPVFYVESEDENVETKQLLALNCDSEPMAKYFIHQQKCMMGDKDALAIEKTVVNANCQTAYKKRAPGCITHISDLNKAYADYGVTALGLVLNKLRQFWPQDKIETPTMLGFLKVREIMQADNTINPSQFNSIFNDLFYHCSNHFETSKHLHAYIHDQFEITYPTNVKGMGHREQVASGIIDIYEQETGTKFVTKPFPIHIPLMNKSALPVNTLEEEEE
ncbi:hypothetical protein EBU71_13400 [bacterium]|nr:hypothetical protein [Candidatus Elulimicrobium humile]